jgi:phosphatidylglycerol lysyltransferase
VIRWLDPSGDAVVGYGRCAGTRVVVGAPICAEAQLLNVVDRFEADATTAGDRVVYLCAGTRLEELLHDRGSHTLVSIGALPTWTPTNWAATVAGHASLRGQLQRARNKGVTVRRLVGRESDTEVRESAQRLLTPIVAAWLATRGLPPLHFMTSPDLLDQLHDRVVFIAEHAGEAVAFAVCTPIPARRGWLVEAWPRRPDVPNGTTHLLIDAVLREAAAHDVSLVTLGLAPLSVQARGDSSNPWWMRLLMRWMRAHGSRFYNFVGLDAFKASLRPTTWEPMYAIARGPRVTPTMLRAVAGVFGGGSPGGFVARALAHALRAELGGGRFRSANNTAKFP